MTTTVTQTDPTNWQKIASSGQAVLVQAEGNVVRLTTGTPPFAPGASFILREPSLVTLALSQDLYLCPGDSGTVSVTNGVSMATGTGT